MSQYRSSPVETTKLPRGIPYIIGNEVAERFSFYGMKGILTIFMTKHLLDSQGNDAFMSEEDAKAIYHLFTGAAYFFPILGALLSDIFFGKYKTIIMLSVGYCIGHAMIAMGDLPFGAAMLEPKVWLFLGLAFIAIGAGGIKPCVSAHVGDQFGAKNQHLVSPIFHWFYFAINMGAVISNLVTPVLLDRVGPWLAFGLPGALMVLATIVFWMGRNQFVHIPAAGWSKFKEETLSPDGLRAVLNLAPIFLIFIPMFWALFDQTGSAWVLQAQHMDRNVLGIELLESQIQFANPFLILVLIPAFHYGLYPFLGKFFVPTPMRKMAIGLFLTVASFALTAWLEMRIVAGETPTVLWQFLAYFILTSAEVMVSITSLEFAYTQAPKKMKSFIMGIYFLGVSLGNFFTAGVNWFIKIPAEIDPETGEIIKEATTMLEGAAYYWFFTAIMFVTSLLFLVMMRFYKGKRYVQGGEATEGEA